MSDSLAALVAVSIFASLIVFVRVLSREWYDVRNRGVNQSIAVSVGRASLHTGDLLLKYGVFLYLFATFYAYYMFERTCARDDFGRARYAQESVIDHVVDALRWPLYLEGDPPCIADAPAPPAPRENVGTQTS